MSEKACSAVEIVFPPGVFITMMPRFVAASTSTLSTPTPARPITFSFVRRLDHLGGGLRLAADDQRLEFADDFEQLLRLQADLHRHVEQAAVGEFINAALGDGIGDEDFGLGHGNWEKGPQLSAQASKGQIENRCALGGSRRMICSNGEDAGEARHSTADEKYCLPVKAGVDARPEWTEAREQFLVRGSFRLLARRLDGVAAPPGDGKPRA